MSVNGRLPANCGNNQTECQPRSQALSPLRPLSLKEREPGIGVDRIVGVTCENIPSRGE